MSVKVSFPNLFQNEKNAGLSLDDWLRLPRAEQIAQRLIFIHERAEALEHSIQNTSDHKLHHVYRHTVRLKECTHECLDLIKNGDIFGSMDLLVDIGKAMQEIKSLPATYNALTNWQIDVTKARKKDFQRRSLGGIEAAKSKKTEKQKRMDKVKAKWLSLSSTPENNRAGIISKQTGIEVSSVRKYIREMELKK